MEDEQAIWDFHDILSFDLYQQTLSLLQQIPQTSQNHRTLQKAIDSRQPRDILNTISYLLAQPSLTLLVEKAFRPLLIDLCARWLQWSDEQDKILEALALLIDFHEELYPILLDFVNQPRLKSGPLSLVPTSSPLPQTAAPLLHRLLLAYYRILKATESTAQDLSWDLTLLHQLFTGPHPDAGVRWLAIRCFARQSGIGEMTREELEEAALGKLGLCDVNICYGEDSQGRVQGVDGWILPVIEINRIEAARSGLLDTPDYFSTDDNVLRRIQRTDLCPLVENVHGILFLRNSKPQPHIDPFVVTSSALIGARKVALQIAMRMPTLITSPASSGKMTLLRHLAFLLYPSISNKLVVLHLADTSLDPRSLLGSYVSSSERAGTFEWKDGVLVKALREGKWVVLKDIDRASNEVLGLLGPLVESLDDNKRIGIRASIEVPNRGSVQSSEGFALFATRSVEYGDQHIPAASFLHAHKWREVVIPAFSSDDLSQLVRSKFPTLAFPVAEGLISLWRAVKALRTTSSSRTIGIRDLEKLCNRVLRLLRDPSAMPSNDIASGSSPSLPSILPNPSLRDEIFLEARDVFFAAGTTSQSSREQRDRITVLVGELLGISPENQEWLLKRRTPTFELERDVDGRLVAVRSGHIVLKAIPAIDDSLPPTGRTFSLHKQAKRLLAQLSTCITTAEPVLLTGETGTGKTSAITYLASLLNRPLVSLNLSNQTEASDLIGGFRPVGARVPAFELQQTFVDLFEKSFSKKKNSGFFESVQKAVRGGKWKSAVKLWYEAVKLAKSKLKEAAQEENEADVNGASDDLDSANPRKRRRTRAPRASEQNWSQFEKDVHHFEVQHILDKGKFAFQFVEGPLVKALRTGSWVLLDEINLASPETLECITSLLQSPTASITLTEQGSLEPVPRHPDFRIFACMNPATDVGKRDLPSNIRSRFTELDVPPPDEDPDALLDIISHYIGHLSTTDKAAVHDIAQFYTSVKSVAESGKLSDGSSRRPHYSMRTLARALMFAADNVHIFGLRRALWEGCTMAFTMILDESSSNAISTIARQKLLSNVRNPDAFLSQIPPPRNAARDNAVQFGAFWLRTGPLEQDEANDYVLTPSVQRKLIDLARIITAARYPILIEGPTSSGKTSSIEFLAKRTGHSFVRINNHEHTDIQEYIGSYISDPVTGKMTFRDGLLVRALRRGDWLVLDELNLAPTDVLEALNRLLDDNRELFITETQEVVKPHPNFMLFATQNPPGLYAGRKVLSRALRNRFLEVHFDDVPPTELEFILCQRSRIAPSYSKRIVSVFHELQRRRQVSRIFEGKSGFATLRDLFRWAGRGSVGYQELAEDGFMLLAERVRRDEDKQAVKEVIEEVMGASIEEDSLYPTERLGSVPLNSEIAWTRPMRRLYGLLTRALRFNEPVLLVGETGSGKTTVCELFADATQKVLRSVNCHQNTEASDIIGGQRPNRVSTSANILQWVDGPLIHCMISGDVFLLDEISLADDSVLERLNSVLEPSRTVVLAEKGGEDPQEFQIAAVDDFKFIATMNPGGDFGKKELSPALRNRFTEIWVPAIVQRSDLRQVIEKSWSHEDLTAYTDPMLDFVDWMTLQVNDSSLITIRDMKAWIAFCNRMPSASSIDPGVFLVHGGQMTVIDGLSSFPQLSGWSSASLQDLRQRALYMLSSLMNASDVDELPYKAVISNDIFQIGSFSLPREHRDNQSLFNFEAPTTATNAMRLLRACQISKPILLEGSPGVGKTSLVVALAHATGRRLCRINLSDQTDLVDLFGSDLPQEGSSVGEFVWKDADFLQALKNGDWVLLDEMNLAPQSVLEGLNAVLDHRGTVFIPELDRSFVCHPNFRIFAAQNPLHQGSGRKGLPKSFLNRFTKVYVESLSKDDLLLIGKQLYPNLDDSTLSRMIRFNNALHEAVVERRQFGLLGSPWEFNLRDVMRWASLLVSQGKQVDHPVCHLDTIYTSRFRTEADRQYVHELFSSVFDDETFEFAWNPHFFATPTHVNCGISTMVRGSKAMTSWSVPVLPSLSRSAQAALSALSQGWLIIVTGEAGSGKSSFIRGLASLCHQPLRELALNGTSDTSDLIGSFEQIDAKFYLHSLQQCISSFTDSIFNARMLLEIGSTPRLLQLQSAVEQASVASDSDLLAGLAQELLDALPDVRTCEQEALQNCVTNYASSRHAGFGWVDGPLVKAMQRGEWLVLDGANQCSPSVLDRLNSLCEINGKLVLTERGLNQSPVVPHSNFRLIMTVNSSQGEISRAMRNRGIEIALHEEDLSRHSDTILQTFRVPSRSVNSTIRRYEGRSHFAIHRYSLPKWHPVSHARPHLTARRVQDEDSSTTQLLVQYGLLEEFESAADKWDLVLILLRLTRPRYAYHVSRLLRTLKQEDVCRCFEKSLDCVEKSNTNLILSAFRETYVSSLQRMASQPGCYPLDVFFDTELSAKHDARLRTDSNISRNIIENVVLSEVLECTIPLLRNKLSLIQADLRSVGSEEILTFVSTMHHAGKNLFQGAKEHGISDAICFVKRLIAIATFISERYIEDHHNYSAFYTASNWAWAVACTKLISAPEIDEAVGALYRSFSLRSGWGLTSLWQSFFKREWPEEANVARRRIQDITTSSCSGSEIEVLRKFRLRTFEVMSIQTIPRAMLKAHSEKTSHINKVLDEQYIALKSTIPWAFATEPARLSPSTMSLSVIELSSLAHLSVHSSVGHSLSELKPLYDLLLRSFIFFSLNCSKVVAYQHILWAAEDGKLVLADVASLYIHWHRSLWVDDPNSDALILSPIHSISALTSRNGSTSLLRDCSTQDESLVNRAYQTLYECRYPQSADRMLQIITALLQSVILICQSLSSSFTKCDVLQLEDLSASPSLGSLPSLNSLIHILGNCMGDAMVALQEARLVPLLDSLRVAMASLPACGAEIGRCWMALARWTMLLYIPDIPLDPVGMDECRNLFLERQTAWTDAQIRTHQYLEKVRSGGVTNLAISQLEHERSSFEKEFARSGNQIGVVREASSEFLQAFWTEQRNFMKELLSSHTFDASFISADDFVSRENMVQKSISNFLNRVRTVYSSYSDLLPSIELSLLQLKFGLRLLLQFRKKTFDGEDAHEGRISDSMRFPFPLSPGSGYSTVSLVKEQFTMSHALLLDLATSSRYLMKGIEVEESLGNIQRSCEQFVALWHMDLARQSKSQKESESLYKTKSDGEDEEMYQKEFEALFPTYEGEDLDTNKEGQVVFNDMILQVYRVHMWTFGESPDPSSTKELYQNYRLQLAEAWIKPGTSLSHLLDDVTLPFRIDLLRREKQSAIPSSNPDFYRDANVAEACRAAEIVKALMGQLYHLSQEWPEQMVLQHLIDHCDIVLSLKLSNPLAQILGSVQQLLIHTDDWEMYANRENTLKQHREGMGNLILNWRKQELRGWRLLLDRVAISFGEGIADWWFRIYDASLRGPAAAFIESDVNGLDSYLNTLTTLLDEFIVGSPLGQFAQRLELLDSFANYQQQLLRVPTAKQELVLQRTSRLLKSITNFYRQYAPAVTDYMKVQRSTIEKEVEGLLQIVTWNDVNVQSLQQSAKRTHHQLFRRIRKFRELLRQPVSIHLLDQEKERDGSSRVPNVIHSMPNGIANPNDAVSSSYGSSPHVLFDKFANVSLKNIVVLSHGTSNPVVEDLSKSIISSLERFSQARFTGGPDKAKKASWQSALLTQKRRAWSELLKELKRLGVPASCSPNTLQLQRNRRWLMELPSLSCAAPAEAIDNFQKIESYFNRTVARVALLTELVGKQHQDISTREFQRGMSLLESLFALAITNRTNLANSLVAANRVTSAIERLRAVKLSSGRCFDAIPFRDSLHAAKNTLLKLVEAIESILEGIDNLQILSDDVQSIDDGVITDLRDCLSLTNFYSAAVVSIDAKIDWTTTPFLLDSEESTVQNAISHIRSTKSLMRQLSSRERQVSFLCNPVLDWLVTVEEDAATINNDSENTNVQLVKQELVDCLLISAQGISSALNSLTEKKEGTEDEDGHVRNLTIRFMTISRAMRFEAVSEQLRKLSIHIPRTARSSLADVLQETLPFLDQYIQVAKEFLFQLSDWLKALFKLTYIYGGVLKKIGTDGFCKPPDEETDGESSGPQEPGDGVGMGEGAGQNNVSDEIEDASQIEGLQGGGDEDGDKKDEAANDDDAALDVDFDFGGKLNDVPDAGSEDDASDDGSNADLDDEFGMEGDEQLDAVDEEFWNDESENKQDEKMENKTKNQSVSETVAREDEDIRDSGELGTEEEQEVSGEVLEEDNTVQESKESDNANENPVQESNEIGDVEDETKLDGDDEELTGDTDMQDDTRSAEEVEEDNRAKPDGPAEDEDPLDNTTKPDEADDEPQPDEGDNIQSTADLQSGGDSTGASSSKAEHSAENEQMGIDRDSGSGTVPNQDLSDEPTLKGSEQPERSQVDDSGNKGQDSGTASSGRNDSLADPERPNPLPNPRRHMGDALQEVIRRFEDIQSSLDEVGDVEKADEGANNKNSDLEYAEEDSPMQALGPARDSRQDNLNSIKFAEDEDIQISDDSNLETPQVANKIAPDASEREPVPEQTRNNDKTASGSDQGNDDKSHREGNMEVDDAYQTAPQLDAGDDNSAVTDREVEMQLQQWRLREQLEEEAPRIWQLYESLTQTLSFTLCEQLRLILEPTKASRLMGDFRTGKRLNMKKIIPYIASNYTKDKIWLRRVKPSQREYQVLIALDDSRSMAESHSIHLAFQTMALVSKALNRLEVGDIAIARFGESTDVLHGFEDGPFTDQVGTKLLENFRFRQNATDVRSLLEVTFAALTKARERRAATSTSASELWQLEIVISDGICHNHEELKALLRKAEEERVLVVFVVIDAPARDSTVNAGTQESIMDMKQATYGSVNGRMELQMQRYMDTFPFEYFVVLKHVESLPDVLSDTLRQFFERISVH